MNVNPNLMQFCDQTDDFKIINNSRYVNMASATLLLLGIKISNNTITIVIVITYYYIYAYYYTRINTHVMKLFLLQFERIIFK